MFEEEAASKKRSIETQQRKKGSNRSCVSAHDWGVRIIKLAICLRWEVREKSQRGKGGGEVTSKDSIGGKRCTNHLAKGKKKTITISRFCHRLQKEGKEEDHSNCAVCLYVLNNGMRKNGGIGGKSVL